MTKQKVQVGKKYTATNHDGVQITGLVTEVKDGQVKFGKNRRVYIMIPGWTFVEKE